MGDFRKVSDGDPLIIPARAYNAFIDAANAVQRINVLGSGSSPIYGDSQTVVLVRNDSGIDVPRFGVLGLSSPVFLPSDGLERWQEQTSFAGQLPSGAIHAGRFGVALGPIAAGAIVPCVVSGLVIGLVDAGGDVPYADVLTGAVDRLAGSVDGGGAQVLWREPGSGAKWAILRVGTGVAGSGTFFARITGATLFSPNRWLYAWSEVRKTAAGYGAWAPFGGGRTGTAGLNMAEDMNSSAGVQGHGIDITRVGFPAGFATVPAPTGLIVRMHEVPTGVGTTEYWFNFGGNVDGACE